jgi:hypothetical protein
MRKQASFARYRNIYAKLKRKVRETHSPFAKWRASLSKLSQAFHPKLKLDLRSLPGYKQRAELDGLRLKN